MKYFYFSVAFSVLNGGVKKTCELLDRFHIRRRVKSPALVIPVLTAVVFLFVEL